MKQKKPDMIRISDHKFYKWLSKNKKVKENGTRKLETYEQVLKRLCKYKLFPQRFSEKRLSKKKRGRNDL